MLLDGRAMYPSYAARSISSPGFKRIAPELKFSNGLNNDSLIKRHFPTLADPVDRFILQYLDPLQVKPFLYNSFLN